MNWRDEPGRPPANGQRSLRTQRPAELPTACIRWRQLLEADRAFREAQSTPDESAARWAMFDALDEFSEACFVDSLAEEIAG